MRATLLVAVATIVAIVAHLAAEAAGPDLTIPAQPGTSETVGLALWQTALVAAVVATAALAVVPLLARWSRRPVRSIRLIGTLVLALSLVPVAQSWTVVGSPWGLVVLHLTVGAVVLGGLGLASTASGGDTDPRR